MKYSSVHPPRSTRPYKRHMYTYSVIPGTLKVYTKPLTKRKPKIPSYSNLKIPQTHHCRMCPTYGQPGRLIRLCAFGPCQHAPCMARPCCSMPRHAQEQITVSRRVQAGRCLVDRCLFFFPVGARGFVWTSGLVVLVSAAEGGRKKPETQAASGRRRARARGEAAAAINEEPAGVRPAVRPGRRRAGSACSHPPAAKAIY
jgi:hypothetical protein